MLVLMKFVTWFPRNIVRGRVERVLYAYGHARIGYENQQFSFVVITLPAHGGIDVLTRGRLATAAGEKQSYGILWDCLPDSAHSNDRHPDPKASDQTLFLWC